MQKVSIGIISFILSLMLFLQVTAVADQVTKQEFSVKATLKDLPTGLVPTTPVFDVKVVAEGPESALKSVNSDDWSAVIDLKNATAKVATYPIRLNGPAKSDYTVRPLNRFVRLEIARIKNVDIPVTIEERGRPPADIAYAGATASPSMIRITGPEPLVNKVATVRAWLDLTGLKPGLAPQAVVEILGDDGRLVNNVRAEDERVTLLPKVSAAPTFVDVPINVRWKNQPKLGFELKDYVISPNVVRITGRSADLARIKSISTGFVDLSTVNSDEPMQVSLEIPRGVQPDRTVATVTIKLSKVQIPNGTPPTQPQPN
jgi:YbbR domain-containing protein